jgi:hypothetical protein
MLVELPLDDELLHQMQNEINQAIRLEIAGVDEAPACVRVCYLLLVKSGYLTLPFFTTEGNSRGDTGIQE